MPSPGPADDAVLAWVAAVWGRAVVDAVALPGASTSTVLRLTAADGSRAVLRLVTEEPWRTHGPELVAREAQTLRLLAGTPVPAPRSIATDTEGSVCGVAAHLVTHLGGSTEPDRGSDDDLVELARTLALVHDVRAEPPPRTYQPWAWEAKYVVPAWTRRPEVWREAFALLREPAPTYEPTFLQRDPGPHNVLWAGPRITGVVDWVETSTGPAWLDVAHCASNLALRHGGAAASRFTTAYVEQTGRVPEPWWEVLDTVGFLPRPGGRWTSEDPGWRRRLEDHLVGALLRCG